MSASNPDGRDFADAAGEPSQLQRGLTILEILASGPRPASALARELDVHRSTALRLLRELEVAGYVRRVADKEYAAVAGRLLTLVPERRADSDDWTQIADGVLAKVGGKYGEAVNLSVPAEGSMVYLQYRPSVHVVAVREGPGAVRPMHCSAIGKAYLAALDEEALDKHLRRVSFEGGTTRAVRSARALRGELKRTHERGYALDDEETFEGVRCVAIPVRVGGDLVGAAGLSAPVDRLPDALGRKVADDLARGLAVLEQAVASAPY
jgi:DNA-binding IclR family transcriptional regulator